jgi:hypothetical protein
MTRAGNRRGEKVHFVNSSFRTRYLTGHPEPAVSLEVFLSDQRFIYMYFLKEITFVKSTSIFA